jgi:hypothetical protein
MSILQYLIKKVDSEDTQQHTYSMNMFRKLFCISLQVLFLSDFLFGAVSFAAVKQQSKSTVVVYFGLSQSDFFEKKIKPLFLENTRACSECEIVNLTPYKINGEIDWEELKSRVEKLPLETSFVYFDFNKKVNEIGTDLVEVLNKKVAKGLLVVGAAGSPQESDSSSPLSRTLLGQVHGALIIGELEDKDRLTPTGFYGPEMLTAIRAPKELSEKGHAPLLFAAELAENWQKRNANEWGDYMRSKKLRTRKIWLELGDIF